MKDDMAAALAPAIHLAIERTHQDLVQVLAGLAQARRESQDVDEILARAIARLEMMRMALGRRDDGPVLS
jgi:hypothetical protein